MLSFNFASNMKSIFDDDTDIESEYGTTNSSVSTGTGEKENMDFVLGLRVTTKKLPRVSIHTKMRVFYILEKQLLQLVKESLSHSPNSNILMEEDILMDMMRSPKTNRHYKNPKSDTPAFVLRKLKRKYTLKKVDGFLNLRSVVQN